MKEKTVYLQTSDKKFIWHPFTQMKDWEQTDPLIIEKGRGAYLEDTEGKRYLDGVSSLWVNVQGHRQKDLNNALIRQLNKIAHTTLLGLANPPSIELASKLVEIAPKGLTKVFYSDSGSTAVEIALKMAYQYWRQKEPHSRRGQFIAFHDAYHGDTLGSVSVGGIELFHSTFRPLLFEVARLPSPYHFRFPGGIEQLLAIMEKKVSETKSKFMGIVMEPLIQGAAGMLIHPKGFLKAVRDFCDRHDLLLIVDEVATGFGRTGRMFACEHENVTPDIMAVAKGITGGYLPLAATLAKEKIYKAFLGEHSDLKTFFHGHTYTGNALACSVALESLKLFNKNHLLKKIQSNVLYLEKKLQKFLELSHVAEIRQCGTMIGIHLMKDKDKKEEYSIREKIGIRVCQKVRDYGVILRPLGNVIVLMPPLSIQKRELDHLLKAAYRAICDITQDA
jgi:adenosylmethionine-8-amino-7-oxononanoate aminotransferase